MRPASEPFPFRRSAFFPLPLPRPLPLRSGCGVTAGGANAPNGVPIPGLGPPIGMGVAAAYAFDRENVPTSSKSALCSGSSSSQDSSSSSIMPRIMSCAPATVASFASWPGTTMSATAMDSTVATLPPAVTTSNGCPMPVSVRIAQYSVSLRLLTFGFTVYSRS